MAYYPSSCATLPAHSADCFENREFGRIRSAGFIRLDYLQAEPAVFDPAQAQSWRTGIGQGAIIMIPETNGESPKASPRMGPAYGLHGEVVLGYDFMASFDDPNFNSNCDFYNSIVGNLNYAFFYRTSSHVYIADRPATVVPNRDIKNDISGEVVWSVEVKWISKTFPCGTASPEGIFEPECCTFYTSPPPLLTPCEQLLSDLAIDAAQEATLMNEFTSATESNKHTIAIRIWMALGTLGSDVDELQKNAIVDGCETAPFDNLLALIYSDRETVAPYRP